MIPSFQAHRVKLIIVLLVTAETVTRGALVNPGFEEAGGSLAGWSTYNNLVPNLLPETISPREGEHVAKIFGAFTGQANTSAIWQGANTAGQATWRASCYVRHNAGDSLTGTANVLVMKIEFYSAFGGAHGGAEFLGEQEIQVLNGDSPENLWLFRSFQATAPAGAVEARIAFVFIQPSNQGGAALLDAVSFTQQVTAADTWDTIWSDEFNSAPLNTAKWNVADIHYNKNNELQYYAPDDVYVFGGNLVLRSRQRPYWGFDNAGAWRYFDYTSGLVDTWGKFPSVYGRVEIRAKLPGSKGMWPALWMLPQSGGWPPEIDIMELTGDLPWRVVMSLHWGPLPPGQYPWDIGQTANTQYWGPDYTQDYHTFALEWWPGQLTWYIDDAVRFSVTRRQVPDEPMYLILNTAVGGDWPGPPDGSTVFPQYHQIDYVRVSVPKDPGYGVAEMLDGRAAGATTDGAIGPEEYSGAFEGINGGFGDVLGEHSQLRLDTDGDGQLYIGLESQTLLSTSGAGGVVIYIDSVAGGVVTTARLGSAGSLPQRLVSGVGQAGERAALYFAPGFRADRAICLGPTSAWIYQLNDTTLTQLNGANLNAPTDAQGGHAVEYRVDNGAQGGRVREFRAALSVLGLAPLSRCRMVATLLDGNTAYRSNEFVGVAPGNAWDDQNPGQATVVLKHGDFVTLQAAARRGDLNADGAIDAADAAVLVSALAGPDVTTCGSGCSADDFANSDLDGDGDVDLADVADLTRRM